jgi:hypothetical protein
MRIYLLIYLFFDFFLISIKEIFYSSSLVLGLTYDGLTLLNANFGENIFVNWTIMNLIELPAQIICYYFISRYLDEFFY